MNGCDRCIFCLNQEHLTYCWEDYVYTPPGGGTGDPGGGGGGSGGGSTPPPCPGATSARTNQTTDPCGPGWQPYDDPPQHHPDPCEKAAKLISDTIFKQATATLKTKLPENKEYAYTMNVDGHNGSGIGVLGGCEVTVRIPANDPPLKWANHSHSNTCELPIFSADDIYQIKELYIAGKTDSVFTYSVTTDVGVYVLVIDDFASFNTFINKYLVEGGLYDLQDLRDIYKSYKINRQNTSTDNEKKFLQFLKRENVGVKILKANSDLSGYSMLMLNRDNQRIEVPCN